MSNCEKNFQRGAGEKNTWTRNIRQPTVMDCIQLYTASNLALITGNLLKPNYHSKDWKLTKILHLRHSLKFVAGNSR